MGFYTSPSFFLLLAAAVIPAVVLGLREKPLRRWGMAATAFFLLLLFCRDAVQFGAFAAFLAVEAACTAFVLHEWKQGKKSLAKYRVALAISLVPLAACKIGAVFDQNIWGFIGISYLTFKSVSVIIEIRDDLIKDMKASDWLYFVCFFPVITSGPIDRYRRFKEDAAKVWSRSEYVDLLTRGVMLLLLGAVYQLVIATMLQPWAVPGPYPASASAWDNLWHATVNGWAYGFYLFFDFAGYSMMAMGASYCFGIKTPRNFRAPFAALDIKDFWNRWHITLSFWLRDFVFMRFTFFALKRKLFDSRLTCAVCGYLINMTLMGAWHGLTPDYLAYGLYHGALLALTDVFQKKSGFYKRHKRDLWFKALSWAVTINLVMFGFALFSGQISYILGGIHG